MANRATSEPGCQGRAVMRHRRFRTAAASTLLAAGLIVSIATAAIAGMLPTAHAAIGVTFPTSTTFRVCPSGFTDDGGTGEWLFQATGLRADGTPIQIEHAW